MITMLAIAVAAYLAGSFPTGFVFGKLLRGIDIRTIGSKSIGATNTKRLLGTRIAVLVLAIDVIKGLLATVLVSRISLGDLAISAEWLMTIAGLCAILGHIFPIWIGFRGGKGVGPAAGLLLGLMPLEVAFAVVVFLVTVLFTRYISLGSILAALFILISLIAQAIILKIQLPTAKLIVSLIVLLTIMITHRSNIKRLMRGTEHKFGQKET